MTRSVIPVPAARRRVAAVGAGVALLAVLAACGSGGGTTTATSSAVTASTSSPPDTTVPTSSTPLPTTPSVTASTTPPATGTPTTPVPSSSAPTAPALAACADLAVTVTRVPGAAGVTYGLISVTSRGTARCALPGVPSLRLLDASRAPMTPTATADGAGGPGLTLAPGAVASTLLEDRSAQCQADTRSAYVEVKATEAAATVVAALALPPCSLSVKPFVAGASPAP